VADCKLRFECYGQPQVSRLVSRREGTDSPERVQEKSPLLLPEEQPADERGDDDERQRDAETPGEPGDAVGQEVSDVALGLSLHIRFSSAPLPELAGSRQGGETVKRVAAPAPGPASHSFSVWYP
jgi:hypothetical protein